MKGERAHILIVDDDQNIRNLLRLRFRKEVENGDVVLTLCDSGQDALEKLKNSEYKDVLVVLSDINMPGMNGFDVIQQVKSEYNHILTYLCSAYDRNDFKEKGYDLGIDHFFAKPIDINKIKMKIQKDLESMGVDVFFKTA